MRLGIRGPLAITEIPFLFLVLTPGIAIEIRVSSLVMSLSIVEIIVFM